MINQEMLVCTQCGFTYAEFQARGLLGCARCYTHFGETLWAEMLQIHPHLWRRAPPAFDTGGTEAASADRELENKAGLKEKLQDALRRERYEEAADLQRRLELGKENHGNG